MKIALAQLNYHIGNFENNIAKIRKTIATARAQKADIVVFSELAVCAYPPLDFLEFDDFIQKCIEGIKQIAANCTDIAAIVGAPSLNPNLEGKNLFNSAYFLYEGEIKSIHHKALLPNYDVFDEYRYFEPGKTFEPIEFKNKRIALTICEDLWDVETDTMYTVCPLDELTKQKIDFVINIAASPFSHAHAEQRKYVLNRNAVKYELPIYYVNQVGAQTELIFDGGSMVLDAQGNILDELAYFEEDVKVYDSENLGNKATQPKIPEVKKTNPVKDAHQLKIERIYNALILGIRDYFHKLRFEKAILGLSGGIDSAVVMALAEKALGKENIKAILMPSQFSSEHSIKDAINLAENLACAYETIPIEKAFNTFENLLNPHFKDLPFNTAEENIQARIRAIIVMALSNKLNYILLNTSNKSELAVGYGTLYGDMCGGISVIGDLYKTEVYELAHFINREKEIIPINTITKAPSAELREGQKDSDSLPPYDILDKILFQYIEGKKGLREIISMGFEKELVTKILKLVNTNEYKRYQTPPILRVSSKAFGMGRRMPLVGKYLS